MEIKSVAQLDELETRVIAAAERATTEIRKATGTGIDLLRRLKFDECGRHPLDDRCLNLIEQVNQTFTYLVTFRAVRQLFKLYPTASGFRLNLGTASGSDVEDLDRKLVAAEVFAAVDPRNNKKLANDLDKVAASLAENKYVFFASPKYGAGRRSAMERNGVQVWAVEL